MRKIRSYPEAYRDIVGVKPEIEADPERLSAAMFAARWSKVLTDQGWVEREWRPTTPKQPPVERTSKYLWSHQHWMDHVYRLVHRERQRTIFVAEPYSIDPDDIEDLSRIARSGWDVEINAERALWFPGRTLAIWIQRSNDSARA